MSITWKALQLKGFLGNFLGKFWVIFWIIFIHFQGNFCSSKDAGSKTSVSWEAGEAKSVKLLQVEVIVNNSIAAFYMLNM